MKNIYKDDSLTIGNTFLVHLNGIENGNILAKIESRNPSFSVKCKISANMTWSTEKHGILTKNTEAIEVTSDKTEIALAYVTASRNYRLNLTMPNTMSIERKNLLKSLSTRLILTDGILGMKGDISKDNEKIISSDSKKCLLLKKFEKPANPEIHEKKTGPKIWNDTDTNGQLDILISAFGKMGVITGIRNYIKKIKRKKNLISTTVELTASPVITEFSSEKKITPKLHKIQGIGPRFILKNLNLKLIDQVIPVSSEEEVFIDQKIMKKEGILAGISSGAAMFTALKIKKQKKFLNKITVVILPSSGERYLSTEFFSRSDETRKIFK